MAKDDKPVVTTDEPTTTAASTERAAQRDNRSDSDNNRSDTSTQKDKVSIASTSPAENPAKKRTPAKDAKAKKPKAWFAGSLALIALAGVAAVGLYGWQLQQSNAQQLNALQNQLSRALQGEQQQVDALSGLRQQLSKQQQASAQTLAALEQRLEQQGKRLQSLSNTSREDWQLAEAQYLLRLAGQRLLMERGTDGAIALLEAADKILLSLKDLDLFSVREKIARDITALKLAASVDQTGTYLRLSSISEQVMSLPLLPNQLSDVQVVVDKPEVVADVTSEPLTPWQRLQANFFSAFANIGDFIKVRQHDLAPQTLLPIDGGLYLQQNIRFSIERAQLAMLREEQQIFTGSLQQAAELLKRYYATQEAALTLAQQLTAAADTRIVTDLPSINGSLVALQDYTAQLHKLGGVKKTEAQVDNAPAPTAAAEG